MEGKVSEQNADDRQQTKRATHFHANELSYLWGYTYSFNQEVRRTLT